VTVYPTLRNSTTNVRRAGYPPDKLHQVLLESKAAADSAGKGKAKDTDASWVPISSSEDAATGFPKVVYEIKADSDRLEPRLRLFVNSSEDKSTSLPLASITALDNVSDVSLNSPEDSSVEPVDDHADVRASSPSTSLIHNVAKEAPSSPAENSDEIIEISYANKLRGVADSSVGVMQNKAGPATGGCHTSAFRYYVLRGSCASSPSAEYATRCRQRRVHGEPRCTVPQRSRFRAPRVLYVVILPSALQLFQSSYRQYTPNFHHTPFREVGSVFMARDLPAIRRHRGVRKS
jgi:hypothetical protein